MHVTAQLAPSGVRAEDPFEPSSSRAMTTHSCAPLLLSLDCANDSMHAASCEAQVVLIGDYALVRAPFCYL